MMSLVKTMSATPLVHSAAHVASPSPGACKYAMPCKALTTFAWTLMEGMLLQLWCGHVNSKSATQVTADLEVVEEKALRLG